MLDAASRLFSQHAYGSVTMDAVAAAAGVSKMTAYSYFADKESLFEATVRRVSDEMLASSNAGEAKGPLDERLNALGRAFLSVVVPAEVSGAHLILMSELRRNPDLARRFYEAGPGNARAALGAIIEAESKAGTLVVEDAIQAADDLMAIWVGSLPQRLAIGLENASDPTMIDRKVRHGTSVFLRAYGAHRG